MAVMPQPSRLEEPRPGWWQTTIVPAKVARDLILAMLECSRAPLAAVPSHILALMHHMSDIIHDQQVLISGIPGKLVYTTAPNRFSSRVAN